MGVLYCVLVLIPDGLQDLRMLQEICILFRLILFIHLVIMCIPAQLPVFYHILK